MSPLLPATCVCVRVSCNTVYPAAKFIPSRLKRSTLQNPLPSFSGFPPSIWHTPLARKQPFRWLYRSWRCWCPSQRTRIGPRGDPRRSRKPPWPWSPRPLGSARRGRSERLPLLLLEHCWLSICTLLSVSGISFKASRVALTSACSSSVATVDRILLTALSM